MPEHYSRRDVLKAGGLVTMVGVGGATAIAGQSPTVKAQTDTESTTILGKSDDGTVSGVALSASGTAKWSNLPDNAGIVAVSMQAKEPDGEYTVLKQAHTKQVDASPWEFSIDKASLFYGTDWESSILSASEDGKTKKTEIPLRFHVTVMTKKDDAGRRKLIVEDTTTKTIVVEVTNTAENGDDGGNGGEGNGDASVTVDVKVNGTVEME